MKKIKLKTVHILIIILGILFILIPNFHTNLWFDESYSVAISNNHNFGEIWEIGGHDVHPVLYYWILKIISLIFGNNISYSTSNFRNTWIYTYKKRLWRKNRSTFFIIYIYFPIKHCIFRRNKNVYMGNAFCNNYGNICISNI